MAKQMTYTELYKHPEVKESSFDAIDCGNLECHSEGCPLANPVSGVCEKIFWSELKREVLKEKIKIWKSKSS